MSSMHIFICYAPCPYPLIFSSPSQVQVTSYGFLDCYTVANSYAANLFRVHGGKSYSCIAEVTSIIQSINWYYKACKKCKIGYSTISDTPQCACPNPMQSPQFKLPLTIKDSSSTMDCIAFYTVAEELVECSALQPSQNMQIEPDNQPPALKTAIGKKIISYRD